MKKVLFVLLTLVLLMSGCSSLKPGESEVKNYLENKYSRLFEYSNIKQTNSGETEMMGIKTYTIYYSASIKYKMSFNVENKENMLTLIDTRDPLYSTFSEASFMEKYIRSFQRDKIMSDPTLKNGIFWPEKGFAATVNGAVCFTKMDSGWVASSDF